MLSPIGLLLFLGIGSCTNNSTEPTKVATLSVSPDSVHMVRGDSTQLTVTPLDGSGHLVSGIAITLVAANTTIATVTAGGLVRSGTGLGSTKVTVSGGGVTHDVPVTVFTIQVARTTLNGAPFGVAVTKQGTAYVLRHTTNQLSRFNLPDTSVATSIGVDDNPTFVAFDSTGTTAYVTAQFANRVDVVTVSSNTVTDTITTIGNPFIVKVSPDNQSIWVSTNVDSLFQIDRGTKTVLARYGLPLVPNGLAFSPANDSLLYVSTLGVGSVVEINYKRQTFGRTFTAGGTTQALAVSLDGAELYVANEGANEIDIFNLSTGTPLAPISTLTGPFDLALSPDGATLWVSFSSGGEVRSYHRVTRVQTRKIATGGAPRRIGVSPATDLIVVANEAGWVDFLH
jgi:DNA-binding beta-propeller fold protein YncE